LIDWLIDFVSSLSKEGFSTKQFTFTSPMSVVSQECSTFEFKSRRQLVLRILSYLTNEEILTFLSSDITCQAFSVVGR
jgi:hypothetical protein